MPEVVTLGVNYRVAPHNSIPEIKRTTLDLIRPVAEKYRLTVVAFEGEEDPDSLPSPPDNSAEPQYEVDYNGTLVLSSSQRTPVAPVSPTTGPVWDLFSGTIQHSFAFENGTVVPVGELMTGNTDTRHYLGTCPTDIRLLFVRYALSDFATAGLTRNIYRWSPTRERGSENIHTINERVNMHGHMEAVKFYYDLIRNFDASDV